MKKVFLIALLLLCTVFIFAQRQVWMWANQAGGDNVDFGYSIVVDSLGNSYVTGSFYGNATFGDVTFTNESTSIWNIFIGKLDPDGNWLWVKQAGSTGSDSGRSIAIDMDGNCYVLGEFESKVSFGDFSLTSRGQRDIFVAKLDTNGNWIWVVSGGGDTGVPYFSDSAGNIYLDKDSNIYITGYFFKTATFGTTTLSSYGYLHNNSSDSDIFIAKLDKDGKWLWAKSAGGKGNSYSPVITVDKNKNCYISGRFNDVFYFGNSTLDSLSVNGSSNSNNYIAKLDKDGNWCWAKSVYGSNLCTTKEIFLDPEGYLYIAGNFSDNTYFGATTLTSHSPGQLDIFFAKLNTNGEWINIKQGNVSGPTLVCTKMDSKGYFYLTGYFNGTVTFGNISLASIGTRDLFIAKLDNNANWLWVKSAHGHINSCKHDIDSKGNYYIIGYFTGTADFGTTSLSIPSSNYQNIFIAKAHIPYYINDIPVFEESTGVTVTVSGGDAEKGSLDNFPIIPNQNANYKKFNIILHTSIPRWIIKMQCDDSYGAYYLYDRWNVVYGNKGELVFYIILNETKGDVPIPIILGNENPALPVELSSFTAYISPQNKINIMWTTQTETGLQGYYIMRSNQNDLSTATLISTLITATNTSEPRSYLYTDEEVTKSGTYYYWLQCNDLDGTINIYGSVSIDYNPGGNTTPSILVTELQPVYPNPFNPIAYIPYTLESKSEVKINIYNTRGQVVKTFDLGTQDKGYHRITWDGRDNDGSLCGNGIYYLVMKAGNSSFQQKAVLMK